MERLNLSTRPFYNERALNAALALAAALVLAVTAFNLWQVYRLSGRQGELQARLSQAESQARRFREQADGIRRAITLTDRIELTPAQAALLAPPAGLVLREAS